MDPYHPLGSPVSSFRHGSWTQRFEKMGDEAERVFEATYPQGFVRYGLARPPIGLSNVPAFIRYTPDYLTAKGLVEVQGLGQDQTFKLKMDKYESLFEWNAEFRVDLFVWDSYKKRYGWIKFDDLDGYILAGLAQRGTFPEGKTYWAVTADSLPTTGDWKPYAPSESSPVPPQH